MPLQCPRCREGFAPLILIERWRVRHDEVQNRYTRVLGSLSVSSCFLRVAAEKDAVTMKDGKMPRCRTGGDWPEDRETPVQRHEDHENGKMMTKAEIMQWKRARQ